ncbi:hypothetical protein [Denitratimonas sp. CY0512]|uniref:hypothetical protein n=1 Tax=Denitratimonas sp. CY0512 TaxID=3131940 RepID=UPI003099AF16
MHKQFKFLVGLMAAGIVATACAAPEGVPDGEWWAAAPGFKQVDPGTAESDAYYAPERFPASGTSVFHPDADLAAPVRALLLLDHLEGLLPHARYRVEWHVVEDVETPERLVHQVQIQRFNLGPARHADLAAYVEEEYLAPVESFGEGPNVAWRFTMAPRQGMRAGVEMAARKLLDTAQSAAADCLGTPCLQLPSATGPEAPGWQPREVTSPASAYLAHTDTGPHPARIMEDLIAAIGEEAEMPVAAEKAPRFVFVISSNVEGQELLSTGLGRDSVVMDDAIGTVWVRWMQVADIPAESALLYEPRR